MSETKPGAIVTVASDLSEIIELAGALAAQAVAHANSRLMPGGQAMVALGPAASPSTYERRIEVAEGLILNDPALEEAGLVSLAHLVDEDDSWEAPLQTLLFWSEERRERYGFPLEKTPTIVSEAKFLKWALDGMWRDEPGWEDFARDVRRARKRLENMLLAGERPELGVPCMYDECGGARIRRFVVRENRKWVHTPWSCPKCKREWHEDQYAQMVTAAHLAAQQEDLGGSTWVTIREAARRLDRSVKTLRTWINRGELAVACVIRGKREGFVSLDEARDRSAKVKARKEVGEDAA